LSTVNSTVTTPDGKSIPVPPVVIANTTDSSAATAAPPVVDTVIAFGTFVASALPVVSASVAMSVEPVAPVPTFRTESVCARRLQRHGADRDRARRSDQTSRHRARRAGRTGRIVGAHILPVDRRVRERRARRHYQRGTGGEPDGIAPVFLLDLRADE
jgi:hypothetical protein